MKQNLGSAILAAAILLSSIILSVSILHGATIIAESSGAVSRAIENAGGVGANYKIAP